MDVSGVGSLEGGWAAVGGGGAAGIRDGGLGAAGEGSGRDAGAAHCCSTGTTNNESQSALRFTTEAVILTIRT